MQLQAHELPPEKLKVREVVNIDIANDPVSSADYKPETDPTKFKSAKTGRGPLVGPNWMKDIQPIMTCYKLVTTEFKWFGLQVHSSAFLLMHRKNLTNRCVIIGTNVFNDIKTCCTPT
jgi:hypothetical protein